MFGSRKEFPPVSSHQIIEAFTVLSKSDEGIVLGFLAGPSVVIAESGVFFDPVNGWWAYLPYVPGVVVHWQWDHAPI